MVHSTIQPSPYADGTYKRTSPQVVHSRIIELSRNERRVRREGKRGCSCYGHRLTDLARYCISVAVDYKAKSWSIYPIPGSDTVYVEFHSWPEMGMCNFDEPVKRHKNYWWDERPVPQWMTGDEGGEKDKDGHFDLDA